MDENTTIKKPRKKRVVSKSLSAIKKREEARLRRIVPPKKKIKKPYVYNGKYLPYDRAKKVVKVLSLTSRYAYADWYEQNRPDYLPKRPDRAYKKEFEGWVEFLGKSLVSSVERLKKIRYYQKLQEEKRKLQEKEARLLQKQVTAYVKYEMRQAEIQANKLKRMEKTALNKYKKTQKRVDKRIKKPAKPRGLQIDVSKYLDYETAKIFIQKQQLKNFAEYQTWWRENRPDNLPSNPYKIYSNFSLYDFLGTEVAQNKFTPIDYRSLYRTYEEAVKFTRTLGITTQKDWLEFANSSKCPKDIPRFPQYAYRYNPKDPSWGKWLSWEDWLGKDVNLRIEAFREQQKVLIVIVPKNVPSGVFSFIYKSGTEQDIDNFIDDNELYVIRMYKIELYDWMSYLNNRFTTYMEQPNTYIISNINQVLFDLDDYMTRLL